MQKSCFASKVEVLPAHQSSSTRAGLLHEVVAVVSAGANVGAELFIVLCIQTVRFCYYMRTLISNVFFAFAAKLHFICILPIKLVPPCWLQGVLLSSDRIKMQILCLQFPYFAKTVKIYKPYQSLLQQSYAKSC